MQINQSHVPEEVSVEGQKTKWYEHDELKTMIKGLVITLPVIIILFVLSLAFRLILNILSPISELIWVGSTNPHWIAHVVAFIILVSFFYLTGAAVQSRAGKKYFRFVEKNYLVHVPLYKPLRDLVRQFTGFKEMPFKQVVLVDPFDSGVLMTGFITERVTDDIYTVFIPTAPNPTNGNIYHVPSSRMKMINTKADNAMRTIVGMGTGSSCLFEQPESCDEITTYLDGKDKTLS